MIESIFYIIQGIILALFGIGCFIISIISRSGQKTGNTKVYDGTVTGIDSDGNLNVSYLAGNQFYSAAYGNGMFSEEGIYSKLGEIPETGLKVCVMVEKENPENLISVIFMRQMGKGLSRKRNYIDHDSRKTRSSFFLLSISLLICGTYCILKGLGKI